MRLPLERGPISRHVIETLKSTHEAPPTGVGHTPVIEDPDAQLALWILYELHYRGFEERAGRQGVGPRPDRTATQTRASLRGGAA